MKLEEKNIDIQDNIEQNLWAEEQKIDMQDKIVTNNIEITNNNRNNKGNWTNQYWIA